MTLRFYFLGDVERQLKFTYSKVGELSCIAFIPAMVRIHAQNYVVGFAIKELVAEVFAQLLQITCQISSSFSS